MKEPPLRWKDEGSGASSRVQALLQSHSSAPRSLPPRRIQAEPRRPVVWGLVGTAALAALLWLSLGPKAVENGRVAAIESMDPQPETRHTRAGDRIEVAPQSTVRIADTQSRVELEDGSVWVEAVKRSAEQAPLVVRAGAWTVTVLGTKFRVSHAPELRAAGRVRVEVDHGHVRIDGPKGRQVYLRDGESFDSSTEAALPEAPALREEVLGPAAGTVQPPRKPRLQRTQRGSERPRGPRTSRPSLTRRKRSDQVGHNGSFKPPHSSERSNEGRVATIDAPKSTPKPLTAQILVRRARSMSDHDRAIELLDQASSLSGPYAEIASYTAAHRVLGVGKPERAITRLQAHLSRWPEGALAEEARRDLVAAHLRRTELKPALLQLGQLNKPHHPEALFLKAEVERARERWEEAAMHYARIDKGAFLEKARFLQAVCLSNMGDRERAKAALQAYLLQFPGGAFAEKARAALEGSDR